MMADSLSTCRLRVASCLTQGRLVAWWDVLHVSQYGAAGQEERWLEDKQTDGRKTVDLLCYAVGV